MKLLAINATGQVSGAEIVLLRAAEASVARGWDVTVACPSGDLARRLAALGVRHDPIPELTLPAGAKLPAAATLAYRSLRSAARLRTLSRRADVVLVNGFLVLPALHAGRVRTPTVWLVHDVIRRRSWHKVLDVTGSAVTVAAAVSEAVAAPLRAHGLTVEVVPNGTPWPVEPLAGRPAGPPVVGCAAMLTSWKGQHSLLEALARMGRRDVVVELAGGRFAKDGPYVAQLEERAAQPDLAGRVRFLGSVTDSLGRMRTWTVAALPSVDPEAAPLSMLEAMSIGLPMVATDHGGPVEMLGDAGFLVPPNDPDALGDALARLLDDVELWERCHKAGPDQVARDYRLDNRLSDLLDLLQRTASAGPEASVRGP